MIDDTSVRAEVAGALSDAHDVHLDDFRLVPQDGVVRRDAVLMSHRDEAFRRKLAADAATVAAAQADDQANAAAHAAQAAELDELVKAIDAFRTAIHAVPPGGSRSPLASAALYEQIHAPEGDADRYAAILFVKSGGGSVDQVIEDRKLRRATVDILGSAVISYWVIKPGDSVVCAAGSVAGRSRLHGTVGGTIEVTTL